MPATDINKISSTATRTSPWRWIPTLYIAEGLPYFAVNVLTVLMFTRLGIPKAEMAFFTGWLYLPWVIKPFWSPFVDIFRTKRQWVVAMELLMAICMGCVAFVLPFSFFFQASLAAFWVMAFFSATHDIAADGYYMLELDHKEQAAYVGVRSTFYRVASVFGQGVVVMLAGWLEGFTDDIPLAWSHTFAGLAVLTGAIGIYHSLTLPRPASDTPMKGRGAGDLIREFAETFVTFFKKAEVGIAICFMLLYRLPEALCLKLVQPFLIDPVTAGGLGLSTAEVGFVNGTVGVAALLCGGIAGGVAIARGSLRNWLWPMALSLTLPCALYCWLSLAQPSSFIAICTALGIEQFGYGFGFTAFMVYMMYFCDGPLRTSHYAFCTAFMALGMMLPGMVAGYIFEWLAAYTPLFGSSSPYTPFFYFVMVTCVATFAVTAMVRRRLPAVKDEEI